MKLKVIAVTPAPPEPRLKALLVRLLFRRVPPTPVVVENDRLSPEMGGLFTLPAVQFPAVAQALSVAPVHTSLPLAALAEWLAISDTTPNKTLQVKSGRTLRGWRRRARRLAVAEANLFMGAEEEGEERMRVPSTRQITTRLTVG